MRKLHSIDHVSCVVTSSRRLPRLLAAAFILLAGSAATRSAAAATIAAWDVSALPGGANLFGTSPLPATTSAPNVTVGGLTRGAGVGTTGTAAARAWGGNNFVSASQPAAITANQLATFTVTAAAGFKVSFSSIGTFDYRRSATGPTTGRLQYQVGGALGYASGIETARCPVARPMKLATALGDWA